jgi:hypothetical protein
MAEKLDNETGGGIAPRVASLDNRRIAKLRRLLAHELNLLCSPTANPRGYLTWQAHSVEQNYRDLCRYITGV